jgi:hypothetical protein
LFKPTSPERQVINSPFDVAIGLPNLVKAAAKEAASFPAEMAGFVDYFNAVSKQKGGPGFHELCGGQGVVHCHP